MSSDNSKFLAEYKYYLTKYALPLVGINGPKEDDFRLFKDGDIPVKTGDLLFWDKNTIFFADPKRTILVLEYESSNEPAEDLKHLLEVIIPAFLKVSKYKYGNGSLKNNYLSEELKKRNYEYSIQFGICSWILGRFKKNKYNNRANEGDKIEKLFRMLEDWTIKTYEGHHVSYGLLINSEKDGDDNDYINFGSFGDFLNDEYGAVLSDGITSMIEIDKKCRFIQYHSITENNKIKEVELTNHVPYRFANVIKQFVKDKKIGVFLLHNGDIIIAKNMKIAFIKRNGKWLNFSFDGFKNAIDEKLNIHPELLESVFSSALDVSLSHCGGIIALVDIKKLVGDKIISNIDNFNNKEESKTIFMTEKKSITLGEEKLKEKDLKKRLLKREIIKKLIGNNTFIAMDRRLKCELISLDGACILDKEGQICSFGAIIQNDAGSSGGGRGAATKKLSKYGGFALKISTDGYIDVYSNEKLIYSIK